MRDLDSGLEAAIDNLVVRPVFFVEIEFISGWGRFWNGYSDYSWDGKTWTGVGDIASISSAPETGEVRAEGLTITISGATNAMLASALGDLRQGKEANIYLGLMDDDRTTLLGVPYGIFVGLTDACQIQDGPDDTAIKLKIETRLIEVEKARNRRWTHEDQQIDHPGDDGFKHVSQTWRKISLWGTGTAGVTRPPDDL